MKRLRHIFQYFKTFIRDESCARTGRRIKRNEKSRRSKYSLPESFLNDNGTFRTLRLICRIHGSIDNLNQPLSSSRAMKRLVISPPPYGLHTANEGHEFLHEVGWKGNSQTRACAKYVHRPTGTCIFPWLHARIVETHGRETHPSVSDKREDDARCIACVSYSPLARLRVHNTHSQSELSVQSPGLPSSRSPPTSRLKLNSPALLNQTEQERFASGSLYRDRRNTQTHAPSDGKHKESIRRWTVKRVVSLHLQHPPGEIRADGECTPWFEVLLRHSHPISGLRMYLH